jgi:hypothetical protein
MSASVGRGLPASSAVADMICGIDRGQADVSGSLSAAALHHPPRQASVNGQARRATSNPTSINRVVTPSSAVPIGQNQAFYRSHFLVSHPPLHGTFIGPIWGRLIRRRQGAYTACAGMVGLRKGSVSGVHVARREHEFDLFGPSDNDTLVRRQKHLLLVAALDETCRWPIRHLRTADATAIARAKIHCLERHAFRGLWADQPTIAIRVVEFLCERLRESTAQLESVALAKEAR